VSALIAIVGQSVLFNRSVGRHIAIMHAPAFQRKRDRVWVWRGKILMRKL